MPDHHRACPTGAASHRTSVTKVSSLRASLAGVTPLRRGAALLATLLGAIAAGACSEDDPTTAPASLPIVWEFDTGLDGWSAGNAATATNSGAVTTRPGEVVLRGWGAPADPDAWISRSVALPAEAYTLTVRAVADCVAEDDDNDSAMRIVLVSGGNTTVLRDWTTVDEGPHDEWSTSLDEFAGETVTLRIEMDDEGEQEDDLASGETVCVDEVAIIGD